MKLWYKEENFINYMDNNKEFLKAIHYLYYIKFKKQLEGYALKDYMVIAYINFNSINSFNNYISFKNKYLLQLDPNIKEAYKLYDSYFYCFLENNIEEIEAIKRKYNKNDNDIKKAYEIKTVWQFYNGFYLEKKLIHAIENNSSYKALDKAEEEKIFIDNKYAIDLEIVSTSNNNNIKAIQCKSIKYVDVETKYKLIHLKKHKEYKKRYNNPTYFLLFMDNLPCYLKRRSCEKQYLIASKEILNVSFESVCKGSYEDLAVWLDNNDNKEEK